jgi:hypothetical protein
LDGTASAAEAGTYTADTGDPVFPPSLEQWEMGRSNPFVRLPTEFSEAVNLQKILFAKTYDSPSAQNDPKYESGFGIEAFVTAIHMSRSVFPGNLEIKITEFERLSGATQTISSKTATDTAFETALGLATFHPANGGEGLLDVGFSITHGAIYNYSSITGDAGTDAFFIGGDETELGPVKTVANGINDSVTRFQSGAQLRVIGGPNEGLYEIDSATYNGTEDRTEISINTSSSQSGTTTSVQDSTDGQIYGFVSFDSYS